MCIQDSATEVLSKMTHEHAKDLQLSRQTC